jgi:hypothetical protein
MEGNINWLQLVRCGQREKKRERGDGWPGLVDIGEENVFLT